MIRRHFLMNLNPDLNPDLNSVIKYTTSDGSIFDLQGILDFWTSMNTEILLGASVTSNTYNDVGLIVLNTTIDRTSLCTVEDNLMLFPIFTTSILNSGIDITKLTSVELPDTIVYIGALTFLLCSGLQSVTVPNSVTSIGDGAFQLCSSLTSITIPEGVTSIGKSAFSGCSSLSSITIPNGVTNIGGGAFSGCSSLISIVWNAKNCESSPFGDIRSQITSFTFGNEVEHIPANLCYGMNNLTSVTIPNSVTSIGSYAFEGTAIFNNSANWENGGLYIDNCLIAAKTQISGAYTIKENTQLIADGAFRDCSSLTSITIPNSVINIGDGAFRDCSSLTSVTIPNSVTSIRDHTFSRCSSLTSVTIPNSVTSIGGSAFYDSYGKEIFFLGTIEDWCKVSLQDGLGRYYLYLNDIKAEDIVIPDTISTINNYLFRGCSSLTSVTIPEGVTSIGNSAFSLCSSLTSVTIPLSVVSIGLHGFSHSELNSINFNGTSNLWLLITKGNYWNIGIPATVVHCTDGDVAL